MIRHRQEQPQSSTMVVACASIALLLSISGCTSSEGPALFEDPEPITVPSRKPPGRMKMMPTETVPFAIEKDAWEEVPEQSEKVAEPEKQPPEKVPVTEKPKDDAQKPDQDHSDKESTQRKSKVVTPADTQPAPKALTPKRTLDKPAPKKEAKTEKPEKTTEKTTETTPALEKDPKVTTPERTSDKIRKEAAKQSAKPASTSPPASTPQKAPISPVTLEGELPPPPIPEKKVQDKPAGN